MIARKEKTKFSALSWSKENIKAFAFGKENPSVFYSYKSHLHHHNPVLQRTLSVFAWLKRGLV